LDEFRDEIHKFVWVNGNQKIKLPLSYIIDCSSEIHHMPLNTCRDENAYIMSI